MKKVIGISILSGLYAILLAALVYCTVRDFEVLRNVQDKIMYVVYDLSVLAVFGFLLVGFSTWFDEK